LPTAHLSSKHKKTLNTFCGQGAESVNVKARGGTYKLPLCFKELRTFWLMKEEITNQERKKERRKEIKNIEIDIESKKG
jgi:hypothetical protein